MTLSTMSSQSIYSLTKTPTCSCSRVLTTKSIKSKLQWPVTSSFGPIKICTVRNHHYTKGLIFWRIQVPLAIFKTFIEFNMHFVHKNKITTGTACVVERDEDRRLLWEHPMVQMYDPWGLGSGQSESTT